jgi:hypothetical protein
MGMAAGPGAPNPTPAQSPSANQAEPAREAPSSSAIGPCWVAVDRRATDNSGQEADTRRWVQPQIARPPTPCLRCHWAAPEPRAAGHQRSIPNTGDPRTSCRLKAGLGRSTGRAFAIPLKDSRMDGDKDKPKRLYAIKRGAHPAALRVGESATYPCLIRYGWVWCPSLGNDPRRAIVTARPASSGRPSQSHQTATFSSALGIGADTVP